MLTLTSLEATIPPILQLIFAGMIGLCFGSFGTMLLWRIPKRESFGGRSYCTQCKHVLAWYDLIPVVSFVMLLGKCRYCKNGISTRYLLVELATTILFILLASKFRDMPIVLLAPLGIASYSTLLIAFYDLKTLRIPDLLITILILSALCFQSGRSALESSSTVMQDAFQGASIFFVFFGSLWLVRFGKLIGSGDILLGVGLGLMLGLIGSLISLFIAYTIGAAAASILLLLKIVKRTDALPFGPFLACGALLALFLNDWFVQRFEWFLML